LEALFAEAAGVDFRVSSDDVACLPSPGFKAQVAAERRLIEQQLPVRAKCFLAALKDANALIARTASQTASRAVNA
jgi:elongation factor P hydroxylase